MSKVALYLGDCLEILSTLIDTSVDAVITDPPYGMKKAKWDDYKNSDSWLPVDHKLWLPDARNLGVVSLFSGIKGLHHYPNPDWIIAWVKRGSTQRMGRLRGFTNWEPILLYGIERLSNDVISVSNQRSKNEKDHPTQKPVKLMKELIEKLSEKGDTILDPFMGVGTTGVACIESERNFIGIEIELKYHEIATKRIAEAQVRMNTEN